MTYDVFWAPAAERQLAELWVSAADRRAVAEAADQIDAVLRRQAHSAGESREGTERIVFAPPLVAIVDVDPERRRTVVRRLRRM